MFVKWEQFYCVQSSEAVKIRINMEFIRNFENIGSEDISLAGGKGVSLAELTRAGFPVPPGFVILTGAFEFFLEKSGLKGEIGQTEEIYGKILEAPMPPEIEEKAREYFHELGSERVAVRSSATAEDTAEAAWAGQLESYLDIDEAHVIESIKKCWASLYAEKAVRYREQKGINPENISIAVVIQQMVHASFSGVAFSVNPVNPNAGTIIIEAGQGLGISVVSGEISPARYTVTRTPLKIMNKTSGTCSETLPDNSILDLAQTILDIERHFGYPVDVEWVWCEDRFGIVQSRPITSLKNDPDIPKGIWSNVNLAEVIPGLIPPLVSGFVTEILRPCFCKLLGISPESEIIRDIKGRLYWNVSILQKWFTDAVGDYFIMTDLFGGTTGAEKPKMRLSARVKLRLSNFMLKAYIKSYTDDKRFKRMVGSARSVSESYIKRVSTVENPGELLKITDEISSSLGIFMFAALSGILYQTSFYFLFLALCRKWLKGDGNRTAHELVASGGSQLQMVQVFVALWKIGRIFSANSALKERIFKAEDTAEMIRIIQSDDEAYRAWREFSDEYGYRTINEINFSLPRWNEDPSFIFSILKNYSEAPEEMDPARKFARLGETQALKLREMTKALPFPKSYILNNFLRRGRKGLDDRENAKAEFMRILVPLRMAYLKIGTNLVSRNLVNKREDIFMLSPSELKDVVSSGKDIRSLIEERNEIYGKYSRLDMPEFFADVDLKLPVTPLDSTETQSVLKGLAVSHGKIRGTARVINDMTEISRLRPGDILVTDHTDPGWTPVFVTIGGVITNIGGLLSHAAIVAREYGLPAVANVKDATRLIQDGRTIFLDGDTGTISLE